MMRIILACLTMWAFVSRAEAAGGPCLSREVLNQKSFTLDCLQETIQFQLQLHAVHRVDARRYRLMVTHGITESNSTVGAVALCGQELWSCVEASAMLKRLGSQCNDVYLAVVDVGAHPDTPRDLIGPPVIRVSLYRKYAWEPLAQPITQFAEPLPASYEFAQHACPGELATRHDVSWFQVLQQPQE